MNTLRLSALSFVAFSAMQLAAQQPAWRGAIPRDTVLARLRTHVLALASDSMAGRRPPTPGNAMAASYIAREFDRLGLTALRRGEKSPSRFFENFTYIHGVEAGPSNALTVTSKTSIRDADGTSRDSTITFTLRGDGRTLRPLGFSDTGTVSGELVFLGYGITDSASGYDDYTLDVRGKIAVIMRYSPDGDDTHGRFADAMGWDDKVRNAVRNGVRGIIFINRPGDTAAVPPLGFTRAFLNAGLPTLYLRDADMIDGGNGAVLSRLRAARALIDSAKQPSSFAMPFMKATLTTDVRRLESDIPNVVAMLPGNDPKLKDELIIIGAHFDHLGDGAEGSLHGGHDKAIHYGADDNASGTAGMLALAEELALRHDNRRTIMFAAFNAEEVGLLGSQAFLREWQSAGLKPVTMINLDMIGRLDSSKLQVHGTGTSPGFERMLDSLNPGFVLKYSKEGVGPSDHSSFYAKGIPVLAMFTGVHKDYHKPSDTWEKVNFDGQTTIVGYVRDIVRTIDRADTAPMFVKADPPAGMRRASGFKVYVGTLPDYSYEGKGMRITGTSGGSPAEAAGLKEGDIIVKMGDYPIANIYDYMDALSHFTAKQPVPTTVQRASGTVTLTIVMGAR